MAELFGFKITRAKDEGESFTLPTSDDGTIEVAGGGFFSSVLDTDGRDKTENDLINVIVILQFNQSVIVQLKIS